MVRREGEGVRGEVKDWEGEDRRKSERGERTGW